MTLAINTNFMNNLQTSIYCLLAFFLLIVVIDTAEKELGTKKAFFAIATVALLTSTVYYLVVEVTHLLSSTMLGVVVLSIYSLGVMLVIGIKYLKHKKSLQK